MVVVDNLDPSYSLEQKRENLSRAQRKGDFQFEERDLRTGVEDLLPVDRIIHLATYFQKSSSPEEAFLCHDINVNASLLLYEAARKTKTPRVLLGSSSEVYGRHPKTPFPDDAGLLTPVSLTGATKLAAENYLRVYSDLHGIEGTILRIFNPYGPGGGLIHQWAKSIMVEEEIDLPGKGEHEREYTFIDDLLSGIEGALDHSDPFTFYNIGGGAGASDKVVISMLENGLGKKSQIRYRKQWKTEVEKVWGGTEKARINLGYEPRVSLEEGIRQVVSAQQSE